MKEEIPDKAIPWLEEPKIVFDRMAHLKIEHWVAKCPDEISGLGKVIRQEDGSFLVKDVMLLPQENTGGSTEIDAKAVGKAMYELRDTPGELNFWWHSHVNMAVFWSKVDSDMLHILGDHGYYIASVFNKRGEQRNAFICNLPINEKERLRVFVDDIEHDVVTFLPKTTFEAWDKEYEKNVKKKVVEVVTRGGGYYPANSLWRKIDPSHYEIQEGRTYWLSPADMWWEITLDDRGKEISRKWGAPDFVKLAELDPLQREFIRRERAGIPQIKRLSELTEAEWAKFSEEEMKEVEEQANLLALMSGRGMD